MLIKKEKILISNNEKLNDIKLKFRLLIEDDIHSWLYLIAIDKDIQNNLTK